ncbi:uncharacterized protein C8orf88 homolog [Genypterus blacodes]|uniref:uncharacterized protein C8orf88 homolog n=1 Tax=Genypterus blacodes TaxID=154954 RepID=UPI003F7635B7
MEVQCKRILRKHLQPARPLRRCIHGNIEPERIADTCAQAHTEVEDPERNMDVELFDKLVDPQKEKEGKPCITSATGPQKTTHPNSSRVKSQSSQNQSIPIHFAHHAVFSLEKIYYTREFLLSLESCPLSKRRPENLLDHPVILPKARQCGLHYLR